MSSRRSTEPSPLPQVLLVERDAAARAALAAHLAQAGYEVVAVAVDAAAAVLAERWDIVVLDGAAVDLLPPPGRGVAAPILIVTSESSAPEACIAALQGKGADACLPRPAHPGVLLATLEALRRRVALALGTSPGMREAPRGGEESHVWKLSATQWTVTSPQGGTAKLTRTEMDFLLQLAREPGIAVARDRLIAGMGHNPDIYDTRRLDVFVSRLRSKVSGACGASLPLRSVHAVGYAFAAPLMKID